MLFEFVIFFISKLCNAIWIDDVNIQVIYIYEKNNQTHTQTVFHMADQYQTYRPLGVGPLWRKSLDTQISANFIEWWETDVLWNCALVNLTDDKSIISSVQCLVLYNELEWTPWLLKSSPTRLFISTACLCYQQNNHSSNTFLCVC